MIKIDGSFGEAGGQIIRTALALSTITQKPFEAFNIRKGRKKPGLKHQHLKCIDALKQLCNAKAGDNYLASEKLTYIPNVIKKRSIKVDIGTAGSISLLLQSLLLPCLFHDKKVKLEIIGGTSGKWAMPFDFFKYVFLPHIYPFAESIEAKLLKRGYYPKGGGLVEIKISPKVEKPSIHSVNQHNLIQIKGVSHASKLLFDSSVADRQKKAAVLALTNIGCPVNIQSVYADTLSPGSGITLWVMFSNDKYEIDSNPVILGSDCLGEKGKKSELVGKEVADNLIEQISSKAPIDQHTADNLIPFMALSPPSEIRTSNVSNHTLSNIWVTEKFLPVKFKVEGNIISCHKI